MRILNPWSDFYRCYVSTSNVVRQLPSDGRKQLEILRQNGFFSYPVFAGLKYSLCENYQN